MCGENFYGFNFFSKNAFISLTVPKNAKDENRLGFFIVQLVAENYNTQRRYPLATSKNFGRIVSMPKQTVGPNLLSCLLTTKAFKAMLVKVVPFESTLDCFLLRYEGLENFCKKRSVLWRKEKSSHCILAKRFVSSENRGGGGASIKRIGKKVAWKKRRT